MHTRLDAIGMRIKVRAELILEVEKKGVIEDEELFGKLVDDDVVRACLLLALEVIFMGKKLVDEVSDTLMRLVENLDVWNDFRRASRKPGKIDTRDLPIIRRCDTTSVEEIRVKDCVISQGKSRVYKLETIIKYLFKHDYLIQEECMVIQEEEERCHLEDLKMKEALFISSLKEEDLSRYNKAPDRVHLTDAFDIFLGHQGPLRAKFLLCKDLLLQDTIPLWHVDGIEYKVAWSDVEMVVSVNTPYSSKLVRFNNDEELIIESSGSLDFEVLIVGYEHVVMNCGSAGNRYLHSPLMFPAIKQLAIKWWDEYSFVIHPGLVGVTCKSVRIDL
nr:phospholipase-like protein [Tanacetum cinerariifolium]